jgi:hypothetical protein
MKHSIWLTLVLSLGSLPGCGDKATTAAANSAPGTSGTNAQLVDPDGVYGPRSDASITAAPARDMLIGDGGRVEIGYNGAKGSGLSYALFYVQDNGTVVPMTGGFFTDEGAGKFAQQIFVYSSDADGRAGFMELETVFMPPGTTADNAMRQAKNISLGMYAVRFKTTK